MAGAERCWSTRLILLGLTEPAGRGTWWVRSGRIKCCLEIAQGIGGRRQGRKDTPQGPEIHKHTHTYNGQIRHPSSPRHLHRRAHAQPHRERQTGKAVRNVQALSLLQRTPTCACNQAEKHTHIYVHMDA